MKKYLQLIVCFFLASFMANAQSAELDGSVSLVEGSLQQAEMHVHWDVVNTSDQTIMIRVVRETGDFVDGSTNNFCWSGLCYGAETDSSWVTLLGEIEPGGTNTTFDGYYYHNGNEGCTNVTYCFHDFNNPDDEVCQEVIYSVNCEVSVNDIENVSGDLGKISPNPVTGIGKFTYSLSAINQNSSVFIYNMVGELVKEIPLNSPQGLVIIDSNEFDAGVYFYSLVSNNKVLSTKKLVVQK